MVIARAPVRISFGGGGTDLPAYYTSYNGFVVSAAITRYCYVTVKRPADRSIRINSADYRIWESYEGGTIPAVEEPLVLPKAAIDWFADRGLQQRGVDLFLASEVAPGTGLGSSSAMTVALIHGLAAYLGVSLAPAEAAELASWIEIERLDKPIGKQDQYASAFGGLNAIEFTAEGVTVRPLSLSPQTTSALSARLMLFSTGQTRDSAKILREQRDDTGTKRSVIDSLHRIKALAVQMREALEDEDLDRFGRLLDLSWQRKKQLSGKISSSAIDRWYAAARDAGALGGKISGAGGGGFLLLYCPPRRQPAVRAALAGFGLREFPFDFDRRGAEVMAPPAAGRFARAPVSERPFEPGRPQMFL